jgi:hypothetical protein
MIAELVRELTTSGVQFQVRNEKVIVTARRGILTPETKALLTAHKPELMALLAASKPVNAVDAGSALSMPRTEWSLEQEVEHWKRVFGAKEAEPHPFPAPTSVRSQTVVFNGRHVAMTFARHNCSGVNHFGRDARSFPFCVIHVERWRKHPFDLSRLPWYRSAGHAAEQPREPATEQPILAGSCYVATCGTTRVVLERKAGHWLMFVNGTTERCRRRDFASVSLQHSQETAEQWYGPATQTWLEEAK